MANAPRVAEHYNARENMGRQAREQSRAVIQKKVNNWLKSCLINEHIPHPHDGFHVLDLACGKGGDLEKWKNARVTHVTGIDIAEKSLGDMMGRYNENHRNSGFSLLLYGADCSKTRVAQYLPYDMAFDLVSCQFALHYAFESEKQLRTMLQNITDRLKIGGHFIGTTVDANVLIKALRTVGPVISNGLFKVEFPPSYATREFSADAPFGLQYRFSLTDGVTDCEEYLVHIPTLTRLAKEYGLSLRFCTNFQELYIELRNDPTFNDMLNRMVFSRGVASIPPDDWEVAYLYCAFSFVKVGESIHGGAVCTNPDSVADAVHKPLCVVSFENQ